MVKQNRVVFLTIMPVMAEKVTLPKLTDISFRQALGLIESAGLVAGEITYQTSEYNNLVLKVAQDTTTLFEGDIVGKGSSIDFVIGTNSRVQDIPLPDLTGLKHKAARELIRSYMLKQGKVSWDEDIFSSEDSVSAFVWKQYPGKNIRFVSLGTSIDIWLTTDSLKLPQPDVNEPQ
jgi:beta-lactam-binding protein with PASTA domain